jgi:hypothetical protein
MHITNLLQEGTRVATAHTILPLQKGVVHTAEGTFQVLRVYGVIHWGGDSQGFAEVDPKASPTAIVQRGPTPPRPMRSATLFMADYRRRWDRFNDEW